MRTSILIVFVLNAIFLATSCRRPAAERKEVTPRDTEASEAVPVVAEEKAASTSGDWPAWGGDSYRNMYNPREKNIPSDWDVATGRNIKWAEDLGSQSYGNPVVVDGKVYVGTNNEGHRDPEVVGDKGNVMCFRESDGTFLWQAIHNKLSAGRVNDWMWQGVCSTVWGENNRIYYVNNRCEMICADADGFADGENDGPYADEEYAGPEHADIIWRYDMIEELGVFPHNLATSSPVIGGDHVFLVTGNGVDEGHLNLPIEAAPSFVAFNKHTGELVWDYAVEHHVLHGQWSSPAYGLVKGEAQAVFPGGDGYVYALHPETGDLIWEFDCNPKDSVWELGGYGTRNNLIATPVIHDDKVYIAVGQDPEHGIGIGHFYCIDATGKGDVTKTHAVWHVGNEDFGRTMSTVAIADGLIYNCDLAGLIYCFDLKTGKMHWKHDLEAAVWASPMIVDGKVFVGDEDGEICVLKHGSEKEVLGNISMGENVTVYTTPTAANGTLYIATKSKLFAIANTE
jgi:outer membrane protein assembly factor BamB